MSSKKRLVFIMSVFSLLAFFCVNKSAQATAINFASGFTVSGGNVGIGTTAPSTKLEFGAQTTGTDFIRFSPTDSGNYPTIIRTLNPPSGGEFSPWLWKESSAPWGIWHDNPDNDLYFTSSISTGSLASNVGGTAGAYTHFIISMDEGNLTTSGTVTAAGFSGSGAGLTGVVANTYNGTINSTNVSAGSFGGNTGGGNYYFPASVGVGLTNPVVKLQVAGAISSNNLAGANLIPNASDMAVYNGNISQMTFIDGRTISALNSPQNGSGGCYQWGGTGLIPVDPNADYEFSIWTQANGIQNIYFGLYVYDSSGNQITTGNLGNPYFHTGAENTNGSWKRLVGYLRSSNTPNSGYIANNASSKSAASNSQDYVMPSNAAYTMARWGSCYGGTSSSGRVYMYLPSIQEVSLDENYENINVLNNNVGIGTTAPDLKLTVSGDLRVGEKGSYTGGAANYGKALVFSGANGLIPGYSGDNSDPQWMARYNSGSNTSELRLVMGDDSSGDSFRLGYCPGGADFTTGCTWNQTAAFMADGSANIAGTLTAGAFSGDGSGITGVSASYAASAGSATNAGNADTTDGYHMNQNVLTSSNPTFSGVYVGTGSYQWTNNQYIWTSGPHATAANSITLYDQYSNYGGSGNPTSYGTLMDIYGRSGHTDSQLYFGESGQILYRNAFYAQTTWPSWQTIITSSNIGSQSVNYATSAGSATNATNATNAGNADTVDSLHSGSFRQFDTWQYNHYSGSDGNEYATVYRDSNDGSYFMDPASVSNVYQIRTSGMVSDWGDIRTGSINSSNVYAYRSICANNNSGSCDSANGVVIGLNNTSAATNFPSSGSAFINSGNVGIGTASPAVKLDVAGAIWNDRGVDGWGFRNGTMIGTYGDTGGSTYPLYIPAAAQGMSVINTSDGAFFGMVTRGSSYNDYNALIAWGDDADDDLEFRFNNSNKMIIKGGSGYVGINNASPSYMLDVSGDIRATGNIYGNSFQYSDAKLKNSITTINDPIGKIMQLRGVTFNWNKDNKAGVGVIAQEVEKVYPEIVDTNKEGIKSVQYTALVAPLIEAVKAQQKEIIDLQARIKILERKK